MRPPLPLLLVTACATPSAPSESDQPEPVVTHEIPAELVASKPSEAEATPVGKGELPWWYDLDAAIYRFDDQIVVLAVGDSKEHHHIAEGFLSAKVKARLLVRKMSEQIAFTGSMPEPELFDLFITREQRFFALYRLDVPRNAELTTPARALEIPSELRVGGMHRRGRHMFEGDRHLFLECDVEGPIANPDWGESRASARY